MIRNRIEVKFSKCFKTYGFPILGSRSYRQHYALIPFCSTLPLEKGRIPVFNAIPWITDSTQYKILVIIAVASLLQRQYSTIRNTVRIVRVTSLNKEFLMNTAEIKAWSLQSSS